MNTSYEVQLSRRAVKSLATLPRKEQLRIRAAIDLLSETPRPPNCVAMAGEKSTYRVRVGNYRIVYEIKDSILKVLVVRIGRRRDVYR
jgi:mRNA interferase RelE/StbE